MSWDDFLLHCKECDEKYTCWGGFEAETQTLIGYMIIEDCGDFIKTLIAKFDPDYSRCCVSDILYFTIVTHYINEQKKRYISSGERTINHVTGTQEYKIRRFGYRKAYCNLHIEYSPKIKWLMRILFVFRKLLAKLDKIRIIHLINSLLKMQEYASERK